MAKWTVKRKVEIVWNDIEAPNRKAAFAAAEELGEEAATPADHTRMRARRIRVPRVPKTKPKAESRVTPKALKVKAKPRVPKVKSKTRPKAKAE